MFQQFSKADFPIRLSPFGQRKCSIPPFPLNIPSGISSTVSEISKVCGPYQKVDDIPLPWSSVSVKASINDGTLLHGAETKEIIVQSSLDREMVRSESGSVSRWTCEFLNAAKSRLRSFAGIMTSSMAPDE